MGYLYLFFARRQVADKLKSFAENKRVRTSEKPSLRDLSVLMKQAPQYQKELSRYSAHFSIAEACMSLFNRHVSKMCRVEQVRLFCTHFLCMLSPLFRLVN